MRGFTLGYDAFEPAQEGLREALTSTGNGYACTRGAAEWEDADDVHYPGTYAHGVCNRETTIIGGLPVLNEDLVNLPNWLVLKLRIEGEEAIRLENVELLAYRHELDVRSATLLRELRFRDHAGRETALVSRRFASMADVHCLAVEWTLTPENWSGRVELVSAIDARVTNRGVARYRQLEGHHLVARGARAFGPDVVALKVATRQSDVHVGEAARTRVFAGAAPVAVERSLHETDDYIHQVLALDVRRGEPVRVEKLVAFHTSRDPATGDTLNRAGIAARRSPGFAEALAAHRSAWEELWRACDVGVPRDERVQLLLRLHASHVLQVCSPHTAGLDAGVPARGLNGEAYRGHVFWDELFVHPYLAVRLPEVARGLLLYRWRRLDEARAAAREAGLRGAMFPWQSGTEGTEEAQVIHLNPLSGRWEPDLSRLQRHVNVAIFYDAWQYFLATGDVDFLADHGAELLLEIARFWASLARFDPARGRYEIHGVMGPDEFHERYPGASAGGLRNNAYTNVMVAWSCGVATEVLSLLPAGRAERLRARLRLEDDELETWDDMSRRMLVPFHGDGIISQFEGYEELEELDWDAYRSRYGNVQRLDRILRAEGDDPNRYKVTKQADVVMLFFLFAEDELARLFARLGYEYGPDTARRNIAYYDARTSHGSTLSFVAHAGALAPVDLEASWSRFLVALESDVGDVQGGTTKEGIHLGVMAGTLGLVQRAYAGARVHDGVLRLEPRLPAALEGLSFSLRFRGVLLSVTLGDGAVTVAARDEPAAAPVAVAVGRDVREVAPGGRCTFGLRPDERLEPQLRE